MKKLLSFLLIGILLAPGAFSAKSSYLYKSPHKQPAVKSKTKSPTHKSQNVGLICKHKGFDVSYQVKRANIYGSYIWDWIQNKEHYSGIFSAQNGTLSINETGMLIDGDLSGFYIVKGDVVNLKKSGEYLQLENNNSNLFAGKGAPFYEMWISSMADFNKKWSKQK